MEVTKPALRRMQKRREFLTVANKGNKVVASTLVLQGYNPFGNGDCCLEESSADNPPHPAESPDHIHLGFTVTKKTGNAVVRNRIRRRLKAAAADIVPEVGKQGWRYVIIGRARALNEPFDIIQRDMRYAVKKAAKLEAAKHAEDAQ